MNHPGEGILGGHKRILHIMHRKTSKVEFGRLAAGLLWLLVLGVPGVVKAQTATAVIDLSFEGDLKPYLKTLLEQRLAKGLAATGLQVMDQARVKEELVPFGGRCPDAMCRRQVAGRLGCNYLVGGLIRGEARTYTIQLWLAKGTTGEASASISDTCKVCGQERIAENVELLASSLGKKISAEKVELARLMLSSDPPGATIMLDGDPVGVTPRTLELPAGKHSFTLLLDGFLSAVVDVDMVSGVTEKRTIPLVAKEIQPSPLRPLGWVAVGVGVASLVSGIALLAIDGQETDCVEPEESVGATPRPCTRRYETSIGGYVLTGLGIAAAIGGSSLLVMDYLQKGTDRRTPPRASAGGLSIDIRGLGLGGRF